MEINNLNHLFKNYYFNDSYIKFLHILYINNYFRTLQTLEQCENYNIKVNHNIVNENLFYDEKLYLDYKKDFWINNLIFDIKSNTKYLSQKKILELIKLEKYFIYYFIDFTHDFKNVINFYEPLVEEEFGDYNKSLFKIKLIKSYIEDNNIEYTDKSKKLYKFLKLVSKRLYNINESDIFLTNYLYFMSFIESLLKNELFHIENDIKYDILYLIKYSYLIQKEYSLYNNDYTSNLKEILYEFVN